MTDAELIQAAQAGNQAALGVLYQRHWPGVWRFVYCRLRGRHCQQAEDLVSKAWLAAIRGIHGFKPECGTVPGWLRGIANNKLKDYWEKIAREAKDNRAPDEVGEPADGEPPDAERIRQVLDLLDDDERDALEGKYLDELSVEEIAKRLGRVKKGIEALLYRARQSFRAVWLFLEGLSVPEIAERLGQTEEAIEKQLYRPRQRLRGQGRL